MMLDAFYNGSVAARLAASQRLHQLLAARLKQDDHFSRELVQLIEYAGKVSQQMAAMHYGSLCINCSSQPTGGCCSLYMAGETDALQMLLNLLAGIDVRPVCLDGEECLFLGDAGCIFLFKPMFCLNYNCTHIHRTAPPEAMQELERLSGALLGKQYELEQYLLTIIRQEVISLPLSV